MRLRMFYSLQIKKTRVYLVMSFKKTCIYNTYVIKDSISCNVCRKLQEYIGYSKIISIEHYTIILKRERVLNLFGLQKYFTIILEICKGSISCFVHSILYNNIEIITSLYPIFSTEKFSTQEIQRVFVLLCLQYTVKVY